MENAIGTMVAYWFVASVWATGAAVVVWCIWSIGGDVERLRNERRRNAG